VLTRKGKPGENRGRKALDLKLIARSSINTAMTAKPSKVDFCLNVLFFGGPGRNTRSFCLAERVMQEYICGVQAKQFAGTNSRINSFVGMDGK